MIKHYRTYRIIKNEKINDDVAFLIGADYDKAYPYICMEYHIKQKTPHNEANYQYYAEALADSYIRIARNYPKEFERKASRDAFEQAQKDAQELFGDFGFQPVKYDEEEL